MGWFHVAQHWDPGGLLWRRKWTFGLHSGKFLDSEVLRASQGLRCVQSACSLVRSPPGISRHVLLALQHLGCFRQCIYLAQK